MITLTSNHTSTYKLIAYTGIAAAVMAASMTLTQSRSASALECIRNPHTVTISPEQTQQSATPGSTLHYHLEITNNDVACGTSNFTFDGTDLPTGWTVYPSLDTEVVDSQEKTMYSISFTSTATAYNDTYPLHVDVSRSEESSVVSVPISYTVVGGQNATDTQSPNLSITAPSANSTVIKKSTVAINVAASDNIAVTKIEYFVNNALVCTGTSTSCSWKVPNTRFSHTIVVKAYDAAGNTTGQSLTVHSR